MMTSKEQESAATYSFQSCSAQFSLKDQEFVSTQGSGYVNVHYTEQPS